MRLAVLVGVLLLSGACGRGESLIHLSESFTTANQFPTMPDESLTPGTLCTHPDQRRYPEKVAYCVRNVSTELKRDVIHNYDEKLGYTIESMSRQEFKIDHFIPLCMGGGNEPANLWPQHHSVYELTDQLEGDLCTLMSLGKLEQAKAIEILKFAKRNLGEARRIADENRNRLKSCGGLDNAGAE